MVPVSEYFDVIYGVNLELSNLELDESGINFVSRTAKNNGVSAKVAVLPEVEPNPANTISVSGGGSVMESFFQKEPYYSGRDLFYLMPKIKLSEKKILFYCMCLRANKYRYSYGRQANKTLGEILIPSISEIPEWVERASVPSVPSDEAVIKRNIELDTTRWKIFKYSEIFEIENGYYNKKPPTTEKGQIPFIGASEYENGITSYHSIDDIRRFSKDGTEDDMGNITGKIYKGNCITVANNGNSVASTFYQESEFSCTHDINVLRLKNSVLNKYLGLFFCTLIKKEKYRWSYGRKWRPKRMPDSEIKLPVDNYGNPDFIYMENFIKSLPYSKKI
ncbi:restriction endonuclease subunit S [Sediminibacterium sp.]|uniref:restriction endonuclease subunit S n=1 Tax=Sediminibacterium sp. TaxID=1917865 RepID=UPI0025CE3386|nr:restriction endonuclease subunit S [Sediminibacterium sp.]MBT9485524.1 restriction endonuclease subunit S [Sediminibacterium sp.]